MTDFAPVQKEAFSFNVVGRIRQLTRAAPGIVSEVTVWQWR